jgi:hypothetical protein
MFEVSAYLSKRTDPQLGFTQPARATTLAQASKEVNDAVMLPGTILRCGKFSNGCREGHT